MRPPDNVAGDHVLELRALQILTLTLANAASRLRPDKAADIRLRAVPPVLQAAARHLSMATLAGLQTPLEVLALATRNTFELWLRLQHLMASEDNCQRWRNENLTDQLQIFEAVLTIDGPESAKAEIRAAMERTRECGAEMDLSRGPGPMTTNALARATGHAGEYNAFYKLYSKLVHPSSWAVNSPSAASTPVYRMILSANAQTYGWAILELVERADAVDVDSCLLVATQRLASA